MSAQPPHLPADSPGFDPEVGRGFAFLDAPDFSSFTEAQDDQTIDRDLTGTSWADVGRAGDVLNEDEWRFLDDHEQFLTDGHLSDFGVSVVADHQVGVRDATEGLDPDAVRSAIEHVARCGQCAARIAAVGGWARLMREGLDGEGASDTRSDDGGAIPVQAVPHEADGSAPSSKPVGNVVPLRPNRRRWLAPGYIASAAAAVAALAFVATSAIDLSPNDSSDQVALPAPGSGTTLNSPQLDQARTRTEDAGPGEAFAADTTGAAAAASASDVMQSELNSGANPGAAAETAAASSDQVLSFDTEVTGEAAGAPPPGALTETPAEPPLARQAKPPAAAAAAPVSPTSLATNTQSNPPNSAPTPFPTGPPVVKQGATTTPQQTTGGKSSDTAQAPSVQTPAVGAGAPVSTRQGSVSAPVAPTTTNEQRVVPSDQAPPLIAGTFGSVSEVADRLRAEPTLATGQLEFPCALELRALLVPTNVANTNLRFARAVVAGRTLTFAIATTREALQSVVVAVDDTCRQVS